MLCPPGYPPSRRSLLIGACFFAAGSAAGGDLTPLGCSPADRTIACFEAFRFTDSKRRPHRIYVAGKGPPVLVLHELPGLTPDDIGFAKRLVGEGYTVLVPLLFGEPGDNRAFHYLLRECGRSRFDCGGHNRTPDPVNWIREFCAEVPTHWPSERGMGAIGMCLTGAFPLALLGLKHLSAAVLCQPTSPFNLFSFLRLTRNSPQIGISNDDLDRAQNDSQTQLLAIRYASDWRCPNGRFNALAKRFQGRFFRLDLDGPQEHSTLGENFSCVAFDEVRAFLRRHLIDPDEKFPLRSVLNAIDPKPVPDAPCTAAETSPPHSHL